MLITLKQVIGLAIFMMATSGRADGWNYWGQASIPNMLAGTQSAKLTTDGTNLFYSTLIDGVYRASLEDHQFTRMPLTGFPFWDANTNTNGYACWNLQVAPHGTLLLSGSPINVNSNTISPPPNPFPNTLPLFYWWDDTNQLWQAATVTNKSYPYNSSAGNFCNADDGSVWTCSGYATYAYRSTDDGHSYTAFDINARVPTNYFPLPLSGGQFTFGKVFGICAGPFNQVVIGTETGGYLHTTNNGQTWASLDPNYTDTNSVNPLGRIGNALVAGLDHYGNFLCDNFEFSSQFPGVTNWSGVTLIGWRPKDNSYFNAANGFLGGFGAPRVVTPPSGESFTFGNQNYLMQGGVYRSADGKNWTQFNQGSGLDFPFAPGITNAVAPGNCITTIGNLIFIGVGNTFYSYDTTPLPVTNRPPVSLPQNVNLWQNSPTNLTLTGNDADGDALTFTITALPKRGILTGTPPALIYTPSNNVTGPDNFSFTADDGKAVSADMIFNLAINTQTNTLSSLAITQPSDGGEVITPTNLVITAAVSDPGGIHSVNFYLSGNLIGVITNAPYSLTLTNVLPGDYVLSARAIANLGTRTWSAPVRICVLPVVPRMSLLPEDPTNIVITWPLELDGFFLETAACATGPWTLSPVPQLFFPNGQTVTVPLAGQQFFRLMHPR